MRGVLIVAFVVGVACGGVSERHRGGDATGGTGGTRGPAGGSGDTGPGATAGNGNEGGSAVDAGVDVISTGGSVLDAAVDVIDPDPPDECRAASQPGCNACCVQSDGECVLISGVSYENSQLIGTVCPSDCPRCASCLLVDERRARELACRSDCDCSIDPGIDPCFGPTSCGCYCSHRNYYREVCPELDVCP